MRKNNILSERKKLPLQRIMIQSGGTTSASNQKTLPTGPLGPSKNEDTQTTPLPPRGDSSYKIVEELLQYTNHRASLLI